MILILQTMFKDTGAARWTQFCSNFVQAVRRASLWSWVLAAYMLFDLFWSLALLEELPLRNIREVCVLAFAERIQEYGYPYDPGLDAFYPRSLLFVYLLSGLEALGGRDPLIIRLLPLAFYYGGAIVAYRFVGGLFGVAAAVTYMLAYVNFQYELLIAKPWTANAFFYLLAVVLFYEGYIRKSATSVTKTRRSLAVVLGAYALTYEGSVLAVVTLGTTAFAYMRWSLFRQTLLVAALGVSLALTYASISLHKVTIGSGGNASRQIIEESKAVKGLASHLLEGGYLNKVLPLLYSGPFHIAPLGVAFIVLVAGILLSVTGASKCDAVTKMRYGLLVLVVSILETALYYAFDTERLIPSYLNHLFLIWIVVFWLIVAAVAEFASVTPSSLLRLPLARKGASIFISLVIGLGVALIALPSIPVKPYLTHGANERAQPLFRWSQSLTQEDVLFLGDALLVYGAVDRGAVGHVYTFKLASVGGTGEGPAEKLKLEGTRPPFYEYIQYVYTDGWMTPLDKYLDGGRHPYLAYEAAYRDPLASSVAAMYDLAFQDRFYDLRAVPLLSQPTLTKNERRIEFKDTDLRGVVIKLNVVSGTGESTPIDFTFDYGETTTSKYRVVPPGSGTMVFYVDQFPHAVEVGAGQVGDVTFQGATTYSFKTVARCVFDEGVLGSIIPPFAIDRMCQSYKKRIDEHGDLYMRNYARQHGVFPLIFTIGGKRATPYTD